MGGASGHFEVSSMQEWALALLLRTHVLIGPEVRCRNTFGVNRVRNGLHSMPYVCV